MTSKYHIWCRDHGLELIRRLAEDGLSDDQIAERAGISKFDFESWKRRFPAFRDAIEIGRREADFMVVDALYKRAIGYNVFTKKIHKLKKIDYDPDTGKKLKEYEELASADEEDYIPPDLRAGIFWLKNRQPDKWCEKGIGSEMPEIGIVEIPRADTIDPCPLDSPDGDGRDK